MQYLSDLTGVWSDPSAPGWGLMLYQTAQGVAGAYYGWRSDGAPLYILLQPDGAAVLPAYDGSATAGGSFNAALNTAGELVLSLSFPPAWSRPVDFSPMPERNTINATLTRLL